MPNTLSSKHETMIDVLEPVIADVVENHPGPTVEQMAHDVAEALVRTFDLKAEDLRFVNGSPRLKPGDFNLKPHSIPRKEAPNV